MPISRSLPRPAILAFAALALTTLALRPISLTAQAARETAVLAGGCFWGVQNVFAHVKGVISATSGYAGGTAATADYETVSSGTTGHAESVKIVFDPRVVSYQQLLDVFFSVAHDPTQLNRQGPDVGAQYRSAVFYASDAQRRAAATRIEALRQTKTYHRPVVTQLVPLDAFFAAEAYHQDYAIHHPTDLYIVINDLPKVDRLREKFPALYRDYLAKP